jgi:hypothetical protein
MASGHPPPSPEPPGHGSSPFVPFVQETQKAHHSTSSSGSAPPFDPFALDSQRAHHSTNSGAPEPMQRSRGFRIPPAFLGLLIALAVAVPTVVATLPQSGQAPSDGGAAPSVQGDAPPDPGSPPATGGDPADPAPPSDPPATDPGLQQRQAVEDCVASLRDPSAACENVLGEDAGAAALYLDCREAGAAAENCLSVLRGD